MNASYLLKSFFGYSVILQHEVEVGTVRLWKCRKPKMLEHASNTQSRGSLEVTEHARPSSSKDLSKIVTMGDLSVVFLPFKFSWFESRSRVAMFSLPPAKSGVAEVPEPFRDTLEI
jgi:hypothetical protein